MQAPNEHQTMVMIKQRMLTILESGETKGSFPIRADLSNYQPGRYFPSVKITAIKVSDKYYEVTVEF